MLSRTLQPISRVVAEALARRLVATTAKAIARIRPYA